MAVLTDGHKTLILVRGLRDENKELRETLEKAHEALEGLIQFRDEVAGLLERHPGLARHWDFAVATSHNIKAALRGER